MVKPAYLNLEKEELQARSRKLIKLLEDCTLCPRKCHVNRLEDEIGTCKTGRRAMVSSYSPHFGEESPLVGKHGSGTIFFTNCSLNCIFCQNYDISHLGAGEEVSSSTLARMMISLQNMGCHNINLVTPSHVTAQIVSALIIAIEHGLDIPLVYNSSGYDNTEALQLLDGIIDIYMPDFKFASEHIAGITCDAPDYLDVSKKALKEMHRQVGDLKTDKNGIAERGLMVRHLVMPNDAAGTEELMNYISKEVSLNTYLNIMDQYRPCGEAYKLQNLSRSITNTEFQAAINAAKKAGITRFAE